MSEKYYDSGKCPVCGSEQITYYGSEIENPYLFYRCCCDICNTTFDEYYELVYSIRGDKDEKDKNV